MHDISVIIINFNAGRLLVDCVGRVMDELKRADGDCVIVDNASSNADRQLLRAAFPGLKLIWNKRNLGFAKAVNQGITATCGRYVLIINPDAFVSAGALAAAVSFLDANPDVGVLGPRILNNDGSVQGSARAFPGAVTGLFGRTSVLSRLFPANELTRRQVLGLDPALRAPLAVDWVSGACMFVRRAVFDQVGLLDDRFFLYWEDADICWRARNQGWTVMYDPEISVMHLIGYSSRQAPARSLAAFHRSAFRLYRTHVLGSRFHPLIFLAALGLSVRCVALLALLPFQKLWRQFVPPRKCDRMKASRVSSPMLPVPDSCGTSRESGLTG